MHTSEEPSWNGDVFQQAESIASAADLRQVADAHFLTVVICDVDVPCTISNGELYVQAPFQIVLDALQAALSEFLGDLETRISETRRTALASTDFLPHVYFKRVAGDDVVRGGGE